MNKLIYGFMAAAVLAFGACTGGSKTTDNNSDDSSRQGVVEQPATATAENFIGVYADPDDGSTLEISRADSGILNVVVNIFRLTLLDDGKGEIADNALTFTATDANGNPIKGKITIDGDTATLIFTDSTWDYLPNGTSFNFVRSANTKQ